jgi:hypothetical protein
MKKISIFLGKSCAKIKKSIPCYSPFKKIGHALIVPPSIEPDIDWFYALKLEQQERNLTALAFGEYLSR